MRIAALLLLVACEKASGVETSSGSSATTATAPVIIRPDASLGTTPNNAAIAKAPADAAVARRDDNVGMSDDEAFRFADRLTAVDSSGASDAGDMSRRRPGADLGSRIDNPGAPKNIIPAGRITVTSKQAQDDSSLTADVVVSKIAAAYMAGIKRCYKAYLVKDATARGKIILSITVNKSGRSTSPTASGFAKEIDDCLVSQMASWRFPWPLDRDGNPTTAAFSIGLQLVPD